MTVVYRQFDEAGVLLYVGMTDDLERRNRWHASSTPWWPQVHRVTTEVCPDRASALVRESEAIHAEDPLYNADGSKDRDAALDRVWRLKYGDRPRHRLKSALLRDLVTETVRRRGGVPRPSYKSLAAEINQAHPGLEIHPESLRRWCATLGPNGSGS